MSHKDYTTSEKARSILILILMAAAIAIWGAVAWKQLHPPEAVEEWSIPMANQNVTWAGAGYNGIWERGKKK